MLPERWRSRDGIAINCLPTAPPHKNENDHDDTTTLQPNTSRTLCELPYYFRNETERHLMLIQIKRIQSSNKRQQLG